MFAGLSGVISALSMPRSGVLWFFFSSRRRHTSCLSDWSSDVCSSDLEILIPLSDDHGGAHGSEEEGGTLEIGSHVRVIRQPWFGRLGRVVELPAELAALDTRSEARRVGEGGSGDVPAGPERA